MPELEPITREEKFLNGEVGMTPITREEKILAGEDIETVTRREYFLKKYRGGGGGDVTVVPLSVTENGTYSEEGKAYSPVSVNVPLPQNAYLLKSVANLPQAIASFSDGEEMVMPSLKVAIEPQQEGSGDPSPENIRPISGWTEANVTVADDVENPTVSNVYTIDLDGTRYGGEVDVVSGVLTVDRASVDLGSLNWLYSDSRKAFNVEIPEISTEVYSVIASCYAFYGMITSTSQMVNIPTGNLVRQKANQQIFVKDDRYTDVTALKDAIGGQIMVYTLATPLEVQLTPTAIKSLRGVNNVYANTGDITDAEYFSKEV